MKGLSIVEDVMFSVEPNGLPGLPSLGEQTDVIMVHGFQYDPEASNNDNPHINTFPYWRFMLEDQDALGFGWFSVPLKLRHILTAWFHGHWNRYRYAWAQSNKAAYHLIRVLANQDYPVTLVGHSLGTRVILKALRHFPETTKCPVDKVLLLNGADHRTSAKLAANRWPQIDFMNIVVHDDDLLSKLGTVFSPGGLYVPVVGQVGIGDVWPQNWHEVILDDPNTQKWGREIHGWDLRGNNPTGYADHWYSYRWPGNWPLYRAFLRGELDGEEEAA